MVRLQENWAQARQESNEAYYLSASGRQELHQRLAVATLAGRNERMQELLGECLERHAACGELATTWRDVTVIHQGFQGELRVPAVRFGCGESKTVHPYMLNYVPTAPTGGCVTWIDMDLVRVFVDLHYNNGVSSSCTRLALCI